MSPTRCRRAARVLVVALACAAGCGDDDAATLGLADPDGGAPGERCAIASDLGDVGVIPAAASIAVRRDDSETGEPVTITYIGALNGASDLSDQLVVQLYRGFGVFTSQAVVAGDYALTGDELNYRTCGVCVRIFADRPSTGGHPEQDLMATGGTLHVEDIGISSFRATLEHATFEHVVIDEVSFESTPVGDGCDTAIDHAVADVSVSIVE